VKNPTREESLTLIEDNPRAGGAPGAMPRQVLIVDDDPITRMVYSRIIARLDCAVRSVASAQQALEELQRQAYDLVILDAHLPDMHGAEIARAVRRGPHANDTRIIAVSTDDRDSNVRLLSEAGVDEFAVKPLTADQLRKLLDRWPHPPSPNRPAE
jgi:CheY-like chemotaxis protein